MFQIVYIYEGVFERRIIMFLKLIRQQENHLCDIALANISEGKKEAISVIYRICGKQIFSIAYQITNSREDSEDLLQEVMISIVQNACKYIRGTNPKAWIFTVTRNLAISKVRTKKESIQKEAVPLENANILEQANNSTDKHMQSYIITDALNSLSLDDRLIVRLKLYVGLSHYEIASVMKISLSCAEKRYERAIKKLRMYFISKEG